MKNKFKAKTTNEICSMVTDIVVKGLNEGHIPWNKPWASAGIGGAPKNYNHNTEYHGSNTIVLTSIMMSKGYEHNLWVTYKGARDLGGSVKKGEHGYPVVFWKTFDKEVENKDGDVEIKKIPFLKYFTVFNVSQCDDIKLPQTSKNAPKKPLKVLTDAEVVVENYIASESGLELIIKKSDRAYFRPSADEIVVPTMRQFVDKAQAKKESVMDGKQHYYSTLFHEMVHSTGTKNRCNRDGVAKVSFFGSHEYSKEELVAEIGSAILGCKVGITSERVINNTKAYCQSWAKKLESEPKWIVWAGGRSEKAVKYILGEK